MFFLRRDPARPSPVNRDECSETHSNPFSCSQTGNEPGGGGGASWRGVDEWNTSQRGRDLSPGRPQMHGTPTSCCSDLRSLFVTQEKQTKPDQKDSKSNMNHRYHVDLCCESRTVRDCVWNIAGLWLRMSLAFTEIFSDNFEK